MEVKLLSKSREGYYYAENKDGGDAVLITAPQDAESYDGTLTAMDGSAVTITSIEDGAFANCQSLKWVTLPESVDTIGYQAFVNCSGANFAVQLFSAFRVTLFSVASPSA